ncbi:ABC transporter ATP-binding protein [Microbacterium sp. X-17]|uniref:ABC transporter ATP-binding protein n=1 Tax=Microbacterium sp. X-17 TaxID=3144404 RepID=UPI0031F4C945
MSAGSEAVLSVDGLRVEFPRAGGWYPVVDDVRFEIGRGETFGLVGESGSGKTMTSYAIIGLVQALGGRVSGSVRLRGQELTTMPERELSRVRGKRLGTIFQNPRRSLDPAYTVGEQIAETVRRHDGLSRKAAEKRAVDLLDRVGIPTAARRVDDYPHTFSGGMAQRVMIAIALACSPELLIADEPTTALDVTVQRKILDLLRELQAETGVAMLFVSHDLGVIAEMCDQVAVMYAGQVVETAQIDALFERPLHPYTQGLLSAVPRIGQGKRLQAIEGTAPPSGSAPPGCRFMPRCAYAVVGRCDVDPLPLLELGSHPARCVRADELSLPGVVTT